MSKNRIGIDIGGVIIAEDTDKPDLFFSSHFLKAKPVSNSFETIKELIDTFSSENIFIISKCGPEIQKKSLLWLEDNFFFQKTGFKRENINFCLHRNEKAIIAENLNLTHFIDDRYTVLKHFLPLSQIKQLFLFNPNVEEMRLMRSIPSNKITMISSWVEIKIE